MDCEDNDSLLFLIEASSERLSIVDSNRGSRKPVRCGPESKSLRSTQLKMLAVGPAKPWVLHPTQFLQRPSKR